MIEKYNFYDVYGYFLPGLAFLVIMWLPVGVTRWKWPPTEFGSAVAALAFAYIMGHLLQTIATNALPSNVSRDSTGRKRYPSDVILDPGNALLPTDVRRTIGELVKNKLGFDLRVDSVGDPNVDALRRSVFFICRHMLVRKEQVSYGEQFEGMYAFMRGLTISFILGSPYLAGWAAAYYPSQCWQFAACIITVLSVVIAIFASVSLSRTMWVNATVLGALALSLLGIGYTLGTRQSITNVQAEILLLFAAAALLGLFRTYSAYKFFATNFAVTVWRDFVAFQLMPENSASSDKAR